MNAAVASLEEWRLIPGYPNHEVSDWGRVRSIDHMVTCRSRSGREFQKPVRGRVLRQGAYDGYMMVQLGKGRARELVHRLVLLAFVGQPPSALHESAHADGKRGNNYLQNLRWATHSENLADRRLHGTDARGERSPLAKITAAQATEIRSLRGRLTLSELSAMFGISTSRISLIQRGEAWS